jgi:hypothetical protein
MNLRTYRRWQLCGIELCTRAFTAQLGISEKTLCQHKKDVLGGKLEASGDARVGTQVIVRDRTQHDHADAWLSWLYWHIAEPLAETQQPELKEETLDDLHCKETLSPTVALGDAVEVSSADPTRLPPRHLAPGKLEELFEFYTSCSGSEHSSKTSFLRTYREKWCVALQFRTVGQHARCTTCTKLGRMRELAQTGEAKAEFRELTQEHVTGVQKDFATHIEGPDPNKLG